MGKTIRGGRNSNYDEELAATVLRPWQQDLYDYLIAQKDDTRARSREIIWVEDTQGNSGKSHFVKWLVAGQQDLVAHKLPISSVDRLISAVTKVNKKEKTDLFLIDITRSRGKEQTYGDLFAAVEDIKNGHVVDMMYGNYVEQVFKPPLVVVFTNLELKDLKTSLSEDRWIHMYMNNQKELEIHHDIGENLLTPTTLKEKIKGYSKGAATPLENQTNEKK